MNSTRPTAFALTALAALGFAACGYPTFTFSGAGGSSTTTTTAETSSTTTTTSTSSAGGGGAGGTATTTTTTTSTTGTGGSGGSCPIMHDGGLGPCEYLPGFECGCELGQRCTVADESTGATKCVAPGPTAVWSKCSSDGDCASGTFCDHDTSVCKKICNNVGDCVAGALCSPAIKKNTQSTEIPGLKLCTSHCDPMSAAPCGVGLTCYYSVSDAEFDCVKSTKLGVGATCNFADDCDKGLVCVGDGAGSSHCQRWCHPVDEFIPSVFCGSFFEGTNYCLGVAVQVQYGNSTYGVCSP